MQGNHLGAEEVLAIGNAFGDGNALQTAVGDNLARPPGAAVISVFLDLEPIVQCQDWGARFTFFLVFRFFFSFLPPPQDMDATYQPFPIPLSVNALSTFFR